MLDAQTCLVFWQGAATHHLRKFNVRDRPTPHVTLPYTDLPATPAAAHLDVCKDKIHIFMNLIEIVIP